MGSSMVQHNMDQVHHEQEKENFPNGSKTFRSLEVELKSYKVENKRFIRKQNEKERLNIMLVHNISYIQGLLQHASTSGGHRRNSCWQG